MKTMYVCVRVCESEQAALTSRARSCEGGTPRGELPDLERANHRTAGDLPWDGSPVPPPASWECPFLSWERQQELIACDAPALGSSAPFAAKRELPGEGGCSPGRG